MIQGHKKNLTLFQMPIKLKSECQAKYYDIIFPLNENQVLYIMTMAFMKYLIQNLNKFLAKDKLCRMLLISLKYIHKDVKVKLLDLKTHSLNPSFVFEASDIVNQNSECEQKINLASKFRIMILDRESNKTRYLITQELEIQYSHKNTCHFAIRIIPQQYTPDTQFNLSPVFKYKYPNKTAQIELLNWKVDEETIAIFGQDFEIGEMEILFLKPHLVEEPFYIIYLYENINFTLINVTNWIHPHQIAIWLNNNDGSAKPTISTIDTVNHSNFFILSFLLDQ